LDPEWRDPAGRAQKGNNGSRRPYIRPQSAGNLISRSRGVKPSRSVKVPSEQSVKQVIYERVVGSSAVGSTQGARSLRRDVRDWDIRNLRIETQVAEFWKAPRGLVKAFVFQLCHDHTLASRPAGLSETSKRVLRRRTGSLGRKVVCDPAYLARPSRTWRDKRAVDRFAVSRGGRLESPAPNSPSARTTRHWSDDSAEDIDSDASRHFRQPRYHRRAELIGERHGRHALG